MKRTIKHISLLTALVALLALLTVAAVAEEPVTPAPSIDMSYVFTPQIQLTVYVDGEWDSTQSDVFGFGDTAAITAPEKSGNKSFSHWTADGSIISYSRELKLTMNAHTTLYAVYAGAAPTEKPVAGFTSITRTDDGESISFQAIASGDEAGIVYSTKATGNNLKIGGTDVTPVAAVKYTDLLTLNDELPASILDANNCWMLQITPDSADTVYHARAYVTVGSETTYGDVKDVKLSDLQSGIWMVANPGSDIDDALTGLTMNTVTFEPNGGIGATMTQTVLAGKAVKLSANTFTREGYTFTGWATKENGSVVYKDGDEATLAEDVTLYAQWKSNASPAPASPTTGPLTVTSEIGTITRVTVDGKTVNSKYYFVSGGSVVLSEEFMSTLAPGKHTIRLYDGKTSATATWTIEGTASAQQAKTAATGDAGVTHYGVLAAAAAAAICAVLACAWVARKRKAA